MYIVVIGLVFAVIAYAGYAVFGSFAPSFTSLSHEAEEVSITETVREDTVETRIRVTTPTKNAKVTSPITIKGEAVGPWFFEGSFPITILDGNSNVLAQGAAVASGNWMQEGFVPFTATIYFSKSPTDGGKIRLHKANASGLPAGEASFDVPVRY
ncbi:hypothetical protein A3C89_04130 [Candidatus Kaiserbacteria bacterium RIFCSPHIGHO2_02_FULL_50_50]|uniref:Bacterial spore germination immunoglobulin-like domain-containing protein n=1 Tax=Candidatus Kaiserbacteria bacterium RIFCSPHIGHO2_02_FULL_50_50 TaxID=1798492 RepID=A0A1F6DCQ1_9BACT|nr:MAG: hypothetical protein A3C89_04130 [Candidatus Kaiserbacteria bacterium RIFCSPHIGHO2_02_FULL_50_50]OGG88964.1 MAG: hypothetical protein A3G62_02375 [Candidatus Kaiserbacteria bacterium RIFCSPLOWO2_12_FULL_50_10]